MSDFSTEWLDLREPADHLARDRVLLHRAASFLEGKPATIVDLGCGTGSTVRAFESVSGSEPCWRLVDRDPRMLAVAKARTNIADTVCLDLSRLEDIPLPDATLVTASALFDLCSRAFIAALAQTVARHQIGLYAALTYDGAVSFGPAHLLDGPVMRAFNRHQTSDKGMGPALGPQAHDALAFAFRGIGYDVMCAKSDWRLGPDRQALQAAFIDGISNAVAQTGMIDLAALHQWLHWRLEMAAQGGTVQVGHVDMLALPRRQAGNLNGT